MSSTPNLHMPTTESPFQDSHQNSCASSASASSFTNQTKCSKAYTNPRGIHLLTTDEKYRLEFLFDEETSFSSPDQFIAMHMTSANSQMSQVMWVGLIKRLYMEVFETFLLDRSLVVECMMVAVAPPAFRSRLDRIVDQMLLAGELSNHKEANSVQNTTIRIIERG